jgi:hypothetical protein
MQFVLLLHTAALFEFPGGRISQASYCFRARHIIAGCPESDLIGHSTLGISIEPPRASLQDVPVDGRGRITGATAP